MSAISSGNPVLNDRLFSPAGYEADNAAVMTVEGTALKSGVLVCLTVIAAGVTWGITTRGGVFDMSVAMPWMIGGAIGGLVFALITAFKPRAAPFTAPVYAIFEGLFLGAISAAYESAYGTAADGSASPFQGIVFQAVALTLGVLVVMLVLYVTRVIRVTAKLRAGIFAATGAIMLAYVASFVMGMFGAQMPYLHSSGPIGIGISLVIVGVAAFNLLIDFDLIERGVQQRAPKHMEWYAGFALLVTLVWLYLEMLRLLSKLKDR